MSVPPIRIVLADDHKMIRESWKMLLENNPLFKVVADCPNGQKAIDCVKLHQPDILLVDINLQSDSGLEVAKALSEELPLLHIIGMSVNNHPKYVTKMMESGAHGFITKTSPLREIYHGIQEVHLGKLYICEEMRKQLPASV